MKTEQVTPQNRPKGPPALGVSLALAAGASLPSKADAVIIVNDQMITLGASVSQFNIQFDQALNTISLTVYDRAMGNGAGWNFNYYISGILAISAGIGPNYALANFYNPATTPPSVSTFGDPPPTFDLANLPASTTGVELGWTNRSLSFFPLAANERFYVGLRARVGSDDYYGWSEFERGSLTHIRTAFQTTPNASIILGQIPEPSSAALLLTAGLAGVAAFRKRRKK
ncbi:MAG: PEP-CTERM sorting domain-containing protein [Verrucomicrobiota bacterium]